MFTSCQEKLLTELKQRIAKGTAGEILPPAIQLAQEFGVNIKTVNKALNRLAAAGLVERRRRIGTVILPNASDGTSGGKMIEIIFSGFSTAFLHPFWGEVLEGAHEVFSRSGYRIILNHILSDPETHLFDRNAVSLSEAAGRMTVGPGEKWLLDLIAASHRPMVCVGDEVYGPDVPQVCFDFFRGINDAVEYLVRQRKCRQIGFIGPGGAGINPGLLQKFNAYVYAVQRFMQVDRRLMEGCWPRLGEGRLVCQAVEIQEDGSVVLNYACLLGGSQVQLWDEGWLAKFVFEGTDLSSFVICLRTYTKTEQTSQALPVRQAAAALSAMGQQGKDLQLSYLDDGSTDMLTTQWTVRERT